MLSVINQAFLFSFFQLPIHLPSNSLQPMSQEEIDIKAIEYNLALTPAKRLEQHQSALETVNQLRKAHKDLYEQPQSTPKSFTQSQN